MYKYIVLLLAITPILSCTNWGSRQTGANLSAALRAEKMNGLTFVAPPRPFESDPMIDIREVGADWIAVVPYAFTRPEEAKVHFNHERQWWGERKEGCQKTIRMAHEAGLSVLLKPQVWVRRSWVGDLDYDTENEWQQWETDYEAYILMLVELAEQEGVEMFCIGTEFKRSEQKREQFWRSLIAKIRERYSGKLVYAANWDSYQNVPFWDALDYVGVNSYFPLSPKENPSVRELKKAWRPHKEEIAAFQQNVQKPIIFTEYGYLSVDGCAYNTWELEDKLSELNVNEQAQANAIEATFQTFYPESWWEGAFLWKWYPYTREGRSNHRAKDYTPQGKLGEETLKKWFKTS